MHRRKQDPRASAQLTVSLRRILVADAVITGAGYALGPDEWHSSNTLTVINSYGVPWEVWGIIYVIGGIALLSVRSPRQVMLGHGALAMLYLVWGLSQFASSLYGKLSAWGGPWHVLAIGAIHLIALWRTRRPAAPSGR